MKTIRKFQKAAALPFVLLLVALNVTVIVALLIYATTELQASRNSVQAEAARSMAQSGIDLAASLIDTPPLLFLDEPTTGLDPRTRAQMWDTIRDLVKQGSTVLLTTQYLDEADQLADRIAVIDHGVVIADGTADELKQSVGSTTLQLTPADRADAPRVLEIVDRFLGGAALSPEAARITAGLRRSDVVPDILIALRENHIEIDEINVQKPTLDEVFLTITGKPAQPDRTDSTQDVA